MTIPILANQAIAGLKDYFNSEFSIRTYRDLNPRQLSQARALICRSSDRLEENSLKHGLLEVIATASSGSDHLPRNKSWDLLDAKGCNAHAVGDYLLSILAYLSVKRLLSGKKIGIVGVGHVGKTVAHRLSQLGFECLLHDPPRAQTEPNFHSVARANLSVCDVITLHLPYTQAPPFPSHHWLDEDFIRQLKPGCVIINAARGKVVDERAILAAKQIIYCCDVYHNEPQINPQIIQKATLCTPHIAGHTVEAKLNATRIISEKLHRYFGVTQLALPPLHKLKSMSNEQEWQKQALAHYNPELETQHLKQASPGRLSEEFTNLRKAHTMRHDMIYPWE